MAQRTGRDGLCAVPGCGRGLWARGWCRAHYERWLKHGSVRANVPLAVFVPICVSCGTVLPPRPWGVSGRPQRTCSSVCRSAARRRRSRGLADPYPERGRRSVGVAAPRICSAKGCDRPVYAKDWCRAHYSRWLYDGDALEDVPVGALKGFRPAKLCSVRGCERPSKSRRLCATHYRRWLRTGSTMTSNYSARDGDVRTQCKVRGCDRDAEVRGWCRVHYRQWLRTGFPGQGPVRFRAPQS